jgi:hypothetical protein
MTGASSNWGFQGDIAAGANRYNLYMSGTADNYMAGSLGIGGLPATSINLRVIKNITGAINAYGITSQGTVQSDVTNIAYGYYSSIPTVAAAFTLSSLIHYGIAQATIGAGSTVTDQIGFNVPASMVSGTNNYAFSGSIPAATGRWNLYMSGTAANYLAGRLGVGATLTSGAMAQVVNTTASDIGFVVKGAAAQTGNLQQWQNSAGTILAYVAADGGSSFTEGDQNVLAVSVFS